MEPDDLTNMITAKPKRSLLSRIRCSSLVINQYISQGTMSVLFGCHSVIHSFIVLISWIKIYRKLPLFWQIVCIFLHDVGHWGMQYLDNYEQKKTHWNKGAWMAWRLFGEKGYRFVAGHCTHSGWQLSAMYKADKYSWYIAPKIWLWSNTFFEPKLRMGYGRWEAVEKFKAQVKKSIESGEYRSTHKMYLERCQ